MSALRTKCCSHFYKKNDLYKFNNKNVVYIADVGKYNNEHIYKYGISGKIFEREYNAHRKNFENFDMRVIKITDNKDVIEDLFEKELMIRNLHRSLVINDKKQTELFLNNLNIHELNKKKKSCALKAMQLQEMEKSAFEKAYRLLFGLEVTSQKKCGP